MKVNTGRWAQESWDSGNPGIKVRARDLRGRGYHVVTSHMGTQVTQYGLVKVTMLTIEPGSNPDTMDIGDAIGNNM